MTSGPSPSCNGRPGLSGRPVGSEAAVIGVRRRKATGGGTETLPDCSRFLPRGHSNTQLGAAPLHFDMTLFEFCCGVSLS